MMRQFKRMAHVEVEEAQGEERSRSPMAYVTFRISLPMEASCLSIRLKATDFKSEITMIRGPPGHRGPEQYVRRNVPTSQPTDSNATSSNQSCV